MALLWLLSVCLLIPGTQGESCSPKDPKQKSGPLHLVLWVIPLCLAEKPGDILPSSVSQDSLLCGSLVILNDGGIWALGFPWGSPAPR